MGLKDRVIETLGLVTSAEASRRAKRAYESGWHDSGEDEPLVDGRQYGYRRAGGGTLRDFSKLDPDTILENVWTVYQSNPLAARGLEIKRDYIVGRGIQIKTDDPELQEILDAFWEDNKMARRVREFTLQLFLLGSQVYPAFVRDTDGRVRLGYIDPEQIDGDPITHPDNALEIWAIPIKAQRPIATQSWLKEQPPRVFRVVRKDEDVVRESLEAEGEEIVIPAEYPNKLVTAKQAELEDWEIEMLKAYKLTEYSGCCFYEKVNSVSNQPRGWSDLLQLLDWADQHDETLFALADREQMAGYFSWDVKLESADPDKIAERSAELRARPPKKGSVNVHNPAEEWTFTYPDIKQAGSIETANALLTFILGGMGLPRHWYGYGDETNRATAQAQGDPTWRSMEHDQDIIKSLMLTILEFVRDQAEIHNEWHPKADEEGKEQRGIDIVMPEMTSKDLATLTTSLTSIAQALMIAEQQGWVSKETAREIWAKVLAELDIEIDVGEEEQAIAAEVEEAGLDEEAERQKKLQPASWLDGVWGDNEPVGFPVEAGG